MILNNIELRVDKAGEKFTGGRKMHIRLVVTLLTYPHRYVSRLTMVVLLGHIKFNRIEKLTHKLENKSEIHTAICGMPFYIQGRRKQF